MPRFFFDFHDGARRPLDRDGIVLDDAKAARREAVQALTQAMFLEADDHDNRAIACHVRDEAGHIIYCAGINLLGGWVSSGGV